MEFIRTHPFIRLLLPLIAGILLQHYLLINTFTITYFLVALFCVVVAVSFIKASPRKVLLKGILFHLLLLFAGMMAMNLNQQKADITGKEKTLVYAKILNVPDEKQNSFSASLELKGIKQSNDWEKASDIVLVYFEKTDKLKLLKAGQEILFKTTLNKTGKPKNPYEFDYARYLKLKKISTTAYLQADDWELVNSNITGLKQWALNIRQQLISTYEKAGITGESLAVLSALTLGYKNSLDAQLKEAYAGAGAMHVLAVSGLHVGIIYFILSGLLKVIPVLKKRKRLKPVIIIAGLWFYALMAGLSPSVMRASTMFTFIIFGQIWNKRINVYNSLAASAFCLLLFNPYLLFDVGFQLSYTAVAGIVFFQPRIYHLIYIKNKIPDIFWQLTSVSLAAQISTLPVTLYYFNQFPVYFWLSNIIVISAAFILLIGGLSTIALSPFEPVFELLGTLLNFIIGYLNRFIVWINNLPAAVIEDISPNAVQMFLFYCILFSTSVWLIKKKARGVLITMVFVFCLGLVHLHNYYQSAKQSVVCVYHSKQNSFIQLVNNTQCYWLINEEKPDTYTDHCSEANKYWKVKKNHTLSYFANNPYISNDLYFSDGFFSFKGQKGFIITTQTKQKVSRHNYSFNYLIVTGNPQFALADLPKTWQFKHIIVDGSVPPWKYSDWESPVTHFTNQLGAFIKINTTN